MAGKFNLTSPEYTVISEVWKKLEADTDVEASFEHFYKWEGAPDEGEAPPPPSKLPALRVEPAAEIPSGWISNADHEERFVVAFVIYSPGWHLADFYGLLHTVRKVFLSKATRQAFKAAAGVECTEWTTGPQITGGDKDGRFIRGNLLLLTKLRIRETD